MDLALNDLLVVHHYLHERQIYVRKFNELTYDINEIKNYVDKVLRLESVACKDWLTNKVDRWLAVK